MANETITAEDIATENTADQVEDQPEQEQMSKAQGKRKKKEQDPRRRLVKIRLQRPMNTKSKGQLISVNNHRFFIPYGKTVEVPFFIAEIARMSSEQDEQTQAMIDELASAD